MPKFTNVKLGKKVEIAYEVDGEIHTAKFNKNPTPAFRNAMRAFSSLIAEKCGVKGGIEAHSVAISHHDTTGNRTVVVSGTRTVEAGAYSISTPSLMEPAENAGPLKPRNLSPKWLKAVDELCVRAQGYLDGEREQGEIFQGQAGEETAAAGDPDQTDLMAGESAERGDGGDDVPPIENQHEHVQDEEETTAEAPAAAPPAPAAPEGEGYTEAQLEQFRKLAKVNIQNVAAFTVKARQRLIDYLFSAAPAQWVRDWSRTGVPAGKRPEVPADWNGEPAAAPAASPPASEPAAPQGTALTEANISLFTDGAWKLANEKELKLEELKDRAPSGSGNRFVKSDIEAIISERQ